MLGCACFLLQAAKTCSAAVPLCPACALPGLYLPLRCVNSPISLGARSSQHRIYRDIRFSSDKTPYKCNFAFTTSRGGRKGIWAKYHLYIEPGFSVLACGLWQPDKPVLERLRARILASTPGPGPLRAAITNPEFVALFGPAERASDGSRQNVFGYNDELKVAPKGIEKTHPQIDLLRLRTIAVVKPWVSLQGDH